MAPSRFDPKGRAVSRLLRQNQAELAQPAVLCFWHPCKCKQYEFRVAHSGKFGHSEFFRYCILRDIFRYFAGSVVKKFKIWSFENCSLMRSFPLFCSRLLRSSTVLPSNCSNIYCNSLLFLLIFFSGSSITMIFVTTLWPTDLGTDLRPFWKQIVPKSLEHAVDEVAPINQLIFPHSVHH